MAYLTIQINTDPASAGNGPSIGDLSYALGGTAANGVTKPEEVVANIKNLLDGIGIGTVAATISVASSSNANVTISSGGVFSGVSGTGAVNISSTPLNFK